MRLLQRLAATSLAYPSSTQTADAALTPSFVQATQAKATSGAMVSAAFLSATGPGDTIVAFVVWSNLGSIGVSDSNGDTINQRPIPRRGAAEVWQAQTWYGQQRPRRSANQR